MSKFEVTVICESETMFLLQRANQYAWLVTEYERYHRKQTNELQLRLRACSNFT